MNTIKVGDKVELTGQFLKCTGQVTGSEGRKVWTVIGIERDSLAVVDEPFLDLSYFTSEELATDPTLAFRRIALVNLKRHNAPSVRDVL